MTFNVAYLGDFNSWNLKYDGVQKMETTWNQKSRIYFLTILDIKKGYFQLSSHLWKGVWIKTVVFSWGHLMTGSECIYEVMFWSIPLKEKKSSLPLSNVLLKRLQLMIFLMHKYSRSKYCDRRSQSFITYGGTFINKARSAFRNTFPLNLCFNQFY